MIADDSGNPNPGARAYLVMLEGADAGREFEVHGNKQIIGRSPTVDTCINAPSVSRQHAQIDRVEDGGETYYTITDLGSSNGTMVDDVRVATRRLENGCTVGVGKVQFKFVLGGAPEA